MKHHPRTLFNDKMLDILIRCIRQDNVCEKKIQRYERQENWEVIW